jgi:hypothetical protein
MLPVAPGTSCRQQIEQLGGRKPLHPVQIMNVVSVAPPEDRR